MTKFQKISLFLLRVSIGWLFFYAGITKLLKPGWTAAGFLKGAKTFSGFYHWLANPSLIKITDFLNEWGLTLIGLCLIIGLFVRISSYLGVFIMILYYLPQLNFPYPNANSFLIDEHIIYICLLLVLASFRAGRIMGLENWCLKLPFCAKYPKFRSFIG